MQVNSTLQSLMFRNNGIGSDGAKALAQALKVSLGLCRCGHIRLVSRAIELLWNCASVGTTLVLKAHARSRMR